MAKGRRFLPSAFGASLAIHAGLLMLMLAWAGLRPEELASKVPPIRTDLVFLAHSGESGGGGGNPAPAPPKPMQIPPHEMPAVPLLAAAVVVDPPKMILNAPVQTDSAVLLQATGVTLQAPPGPGGGGRGPGVGPGDNDGVGPGRQGGTGGGPRRLGDGVTSPEVIKKVSPVYPNDAMQARISGSVTVEAVVLANGTVGEVKVISAPGRAHGFDVEAIRAARQWIFKPGMFEGKPVDVIVRIVLEFNLH